MGSYTDLIIYTANDCRTRQFIENDSRTPTNFQNTWRALYFQNTSCTPLLFFEIPGILVGPCSTAPVGSVGSFNFKRVRDFKQGF
jgi:hypothetical protein